ncbi:MAG: DUF72 domain-containing protein [Acidobacteriota bacterium]
MIYIGTSGFSYSEWKGFFYPEKLSPKEYLSYYARHFTTTEINYTFYRIPSEASVRDWASQVPDEFRFTLKLNQQITHKKRLRDVDDEMKRFLGSALGLDSRLAVILVQLPPYFRKDVSVLSSFLEAYSSQVRLAVEFRHDSWQCEEVLSTLRRHGAAQAIVETLEKPAVREITAPFVYMRLRKEDYTPDEMRNWAQWISSRPGDVFVYFKHEDRAPLLARQLQEEIGLA